MIKLYSKWAYGVQVHLKTTLGLEKFDYEVLIILYNKITVTKKSIQIRYDLNTKIVYFD